MDRAVSTVLDVAICLLLVGVAIGTLTAAIPDDGRSSTVDGDPEAVSVATVTATVPAGGGRSAHGTLAQHLARATVVGATLDGERLLVSRYPDATVAAVENRTGDRVRVTTRWRPYPGAPIGGRLSAGPSPPSTADVAVTRLAVDSGVSAPRSSTGAFATALARGFVDLLFPPERTRIRLVDPRTAASTADRYRTAADTLGTDVEEPIGNAFPNRANERLAAEIAGRVEDDIDSGANGTDAVPPEAAPGAVEIVVRRWEP